ncbi:4'-phosphopantetheinyl transferase [Inquilinus ginsengisoli]|uniref:4'-phosphopantetheinyl transferase n=1 Tax=Inquilinus ginsengisoli TaxID=363840 RepID=A0ABU1JKW8_9PROT|nr:4'-phosphopantetheinyl transferase superfamily protein [Inquilinus ginsengisoli]MDR6289262.1 4'-phosphopantetheinyl transferase [Inquilinus ginsengisoli]
MTDRAADIDVWTAEVAEDDPGDDRNVEACWPLLTEAERARAARFAVPGDRRRFACARVLLRRLLEAKTGVPAREWDFAAGDHGKPFVCAPEAGRRIGINISHAEGMVACAMAPGTMIGIDLEWLGRVVEPRIADRRFAAAEAAALKAVPADRRREAFLDLWTVKEAYVKALGGGLTISLDGFVVDAVSDRPVVRFLDPAVDGASWHFRHWRPSPRHVLGLAVRWPGAEPVIAVRHVPLPAGLLAPG